MNRREEQKPITALARGETCQVRLPGICNFNKETTVPAHYRLIGISGAAMISTPLNVAWACFACHVYCDTHHDTETKLALAEGVMRTSAILWNRGAVVAA